MQAKRIVMNHGDLSLNQQLSVSMFPPDEPREEINYHNIWASVTAEPEDAGANSSGVWVLWIKTDQTAADATFTLANLQAETFNQRIIACGAWAASNESPYSSGPIHPLTSRTLMVGEALKLSIIAHGQTIGDTSYNVLLCAHTTRK